MEVISSRDLSKNYGATPALKTVNLSVRQGEIFGFLGPNGAGKTTFVKIMLSFIRASFGELNVLGSPPGKFDRKRIGYLPERISIHPFLTAREFLRYQGRLIDLSGRFLEERIDQCLAMVKMTEASDRRVETYSKGMMQRIGVAQAVLGEPELLVLDEPNSGLDPIGIQDIREIIQKERDRGATVFLNSHQLLEVEKTCDRVAILNRGELVAAGTKEELSGKQGVIMELENASQKLLELFKKMDPTFKATGSTLELAIPESEEERQLPSKIVESGARIISYSRRRESLEQIFARLIRSEESASGANS